MRTPGTLGPGCGLAENILGCADTVRNARRAGAVSLGHQPDGGTRIRKKVTGRTKAEVRDELRELHQGVSSGLRPRKRYGVPVEAIALLTGHNQTATTEPVYRHQIVPALTRGAEVMDQIFD